MPLARINLGQHATPDFVRAVSDAVYDAMTAAANVPAHDKFQIISRHAPDELVYPAEGYLGIDYSRDIVFIQITWNAGRGTDVKKAFYRTLVDDIHARTGARKQDIWINLVEVQRENWSFGNGEMQYASQ